MFHVLGFMMLGVFVGCIILLVVLDTREDWRQADRERLRRIEQDLGLSPWWFEDEPHPPEPPPSNIIEVPDMPPRKPTFKHHPHPITEKPLSRGHPLTSKPDWARINREGKLWALREARGHQLRSERMKPQVISRGEEPTGWDP